MLICQCTSKGGACCNLYADPHNYYSSVIRFTLAHENGSTRIHGQTDLCVYIRKAPHMHYLVIHLLHWLWKKSSIMKLSVGGETFQLYYGTLKAASYFRNLNKMVPQRNAISIHQEGSVCHFMASATWSRESIKCCTLLP